IEPVPVWAPTGGMSVARHDMTAIPLLDGSVLVAGGQRTGAVDTGDLYFATAEVFLPLPGEFLKVPVKMPQRRAHHVGVALEDGRVLLAGGISDQSTTTSEVFDPMTGGWTESALLHPHGAGTAMVRLADGRPMLIGGESSGGAVELFDPATLTWSDAP